MSALDKLIEDATRLAAAAESQSVVMARLISNVERLQDCYVEKLDEIIRLRAIAEQWRAEVERLRAAGDALAEALAWWGKGNEAGDAARKAWQEARRER